MDLYHLLTQEEPTAKADIIALPNHRQKVCAPVITIITAEKLLQASQKAQLRQLCLSETIKTVRNLQAMMKS